MKKTLLIIALLLLSSCSYNQQPADNHKGEKTNFSAEIITLLEDTHGGKVEPLYVTRWIPDKNTPGSSSPKDVQENGISIRRVQKDEAKELFNNLYEKLYEKGYLIFLTNLDFDYENPPVNGSRAIYDVGIIEGNDQYKIIEMINTEAGNYNISNKEITEKLKEWEKTIPFRIVVVDNDRVEAEILEMPDNIESFAIKIFDFSPDTVHQGAGSLEELTETIKEDKYFWLWWD